jgi:glyoxylase-like metal-dependent hydrolase (beta-lactamase superfamily II)
MRHTHTPQTHRGHAPRERAVSPLPTPPAECWQRRCERAQEVEVLQLRQVVQRLGQRLAALGAQRVVPAHGGDEQEPKGRGRRTQLWVGTKRVR